MPGAVAEATERFPEDDGGEEGFNEVHAVSGKGLQGNQRHSAPPIAQVIGPRPQALFSEDQGWQILIWFWVSLFPGSPAPAPWWTYLAWPPPGAWVMVPLVA